MPRFGAHLSVSEFRNKASERITGPAAAIERARALRCDCVQLFLRPNRQWTAPALSAGHVQAFRDAIERPVRHRESYQDETGKRRTRTRSDSLHPVVSHAAYLINIAGPSGKRPSGGTSEQSWPKRDIRAKSIRALKDEIARAAALGVPYVVLHPGNHMGDGDEAGLRRVVEALDEVLDPHATDPVTVLLETTAGQGSSVGCRLEHLAWIIDHAAHADHLAVCADTCHLFAAGYDLRSLDGYEATIREIDRTVGLERLKVWHLNDSLKDLGCRVDRHTHIGRGKIGREAFRRLVNDPRFADCAMILETPKQDDDGREMDPVNLRLLRRLLAS
jgi:deoxyribonuclease IV